MTLANYITILRFLLVPVFVTAMLYYNASGREGLPNENYRLAAVMIFIVASVSDALDGYIARTFKQKSVLGSILDPLADKALILSGIVMLSYIHVPGLWRLPIWFPVLVISRDILLLAGIGFIYFIMRSVKIEPHMTGKIASFLQMFILAAILLKIPKIPYLPLAYLCGFFLLIASTIYLFRGIFILRASGYGHPMN